MSNLRSFEIQQLVKASSMQVLFAFVNPEAIRAWWGARNVVVQPRPGGLFLVEWEPGHGGQDAVLGGLGGVLGGILDSAQAGHYVHFGALHWLSPKGETFGPTRLEIDVRSKGDPRAKPTLLTLRGQAFQTGGAWDRYFEVSKAAWETTIQTLKTWCETKAPEQPEPRIMGLGDSYLAEAVLQKRPIS
jgi:uncharacterized protein YndB with AHSA1/START domain